MADVTISQLIPGVPDSSAVLPYTDGTSTYKATVGQIGVPIGTIVMWNNRGGASIPSNWALCDGTNGTPDLRDKFIVGSGNTYAIGAVGGSKDAVVVAHSHTVTDPGHSHSGVITGGSSRVFSNGSIGSGGSSGINGLSSGSSSSNTTGITIASTGSSGTNANLPPYYALAYIQKIA